LEFYQVRLVLPQFFQAKTLVVPSHDRRLFGSLNILWLRVKKNESSVPHYIQSARIAQKRLLRNVI
jgi:hypothetical protein